MTILHVGAKTDPKKLAKVIKKNVIEHNVAEMRMIGASSVNQAVKAVAIARKFFVSRDSDLICTPSFTKVEGKNEDDKSTAILFTIGKI